YLMVPGARGMRFYDNGPHLHEYLAQFRRVLDGYDCMAVGEAPMITPHKALPFIEEGPDQTLDMMFNFEHMGADCLFTDFVPMPFSLRRYKDALTRWQRELDGRAWNALYIENHDHPRIVSRYGSEQYREKSAMTLAASYLFLKGTPFIYQGQEIGMVNTRFSTIDEVPDVSAINQYRNHIASGDSPEKAMELINRAARDHARTPVQWSAEPHAGFCPADVDPWLAENPNYPEINVERDEADPDSVLNFYRKAVALRRELAVVRDGSYREFKRASDVHYFYVREDDDEKLLVMCSFADKQTLFRMPLGFELEKGELLLANYDDAPGARPDGFYAFRPYECRVYRFEA
ncbi:MAG: alpha-amylase family glycosyl hydrolase, partial [Coriobacteriaceae bacterium]|nr:alpha-amylase family glycosyl hydrolase [Coriobacteriaceae bacterium]